MNLGFDVLFRRDLIRFAVAPFGEPHERRGAVLLLGTLPAETDAELRRLEVEVVRVTSVLQALESLSSQRFHSVAVSPEIDGALGLVKQVKQGKGASDSDLAWEAASRNMLTPIVVLPFAGDDEYAVIVAPPVVAFLERASVVPLSYALLRVDVERLVQPKN